MLFIKMRNSNGPSTERALTRVEYVGNDTPVDGTYGVRHLFALSY